MSRYPLKRMLTPIMLLIALSLAGCGTLRQGAIRISEEDYNNWACVVEVGQAFMLSWPAKSGFIRCALGPDIDRLPAETVKAMDAMDKLAKKAPEWTDSDYT